MNIEPVDFDASKIPDHAERRLKYQELEKLHTQPGRWFMVAYMTRMAFKNLASGDTKVPGDKNRYSWKQDLSNVDPTDKKKFAVYANYK